MTQKYKEWGELSTPVESAKDYRGVRFSPKASLEKPFIPTLTRRGVSKEFGRYASAKEAARVYDNAAFYTHPWCGTTGLSRTKLLNFPHEYEGPTPPPILPQVEEFVAKLRDRFPDAEAYYYDRQSAGSAQDRVNHLLEALATLIVGANQIKMMVEDVVAVLAKETLDRQSAVNQNRRLLAEIERLNAALEKARAINTSSVLDALKND